MKSVTKIGKSLPTNRDFLCYEVKPLTIFALADLAALEKQIAGCSKEITAAASDYVRLQELMTQKESLEVQLEQKTERWVYLNELAEKIEAQMAES